MSQHIHLSSEGPETELCSDEKAFEIMSTLVKTRNKNDKFTPDELKSYKNFITVKGKYLTNFTKKSQNTNHIHSNIYWLLIKPFTYLNAYGNLSRNRGSTTPGIDGSSISGFSWKDCQTIAEQIKNQSYTPTPTKRVWIDKPGKKEKRPLGIPSIKDRIIQEAIRGVLEAIYEPIFEEAYKNSKNRCINFGFRPGLSCWDAIQNLVTYGQGINLVIEGDIKGAYDNVDHDILLSLLNKRIKDAKFLGLIRKFLKSGVMDMGEYRHSLLGVPQGGIISPLLFNIYMFELDQFIMEIFNKGEEENTHLPSNPNKDPYYQRLTYRTRRIVEAYRKETDPGRKKELYKELKAQRRILFQTPSYSKDKLRRKFIYIRYADDWILGFSGSKMEAEELKLSVAEFLQNSLKLKLSEQKTKITNIRKDFILFLGYQISIQADYNRTKKLIIRQKTSKGWTASIRRTTAGKFYVIPEKNKILKNLKTRGFCKDKDYFPVGIRAWSNLNEYQIVQKYRSIFIGLIQHYRNCDNLTILNRASYILQYSCAKTIATRQKITMPQVFEKYGKDLKISTTIKTSKTGDMKNLTTEFIDLTNWKKRYGLSNAAGLRREWDPFKIITFWRTKFKTITFCTICGSTENVQMHHTNSIKSIGKKVTGFNLILRQINRKQIPVCQTCHARITAGKYNHMKLSDLYDQELAKL